MENAQELKIKIDSIVRNGKRFWEIDSPGTYYVLDIMFMKAQVWRVEEANRINIKYRGETETKLKSVSRKLVRNRTYYFGQKEFDELKQLIAALELPEAVERKCLRLFSSPATISKIKRLSFSEQMQLIQLLDPHWDWDKEKEGS